MEIKAVLCETSGAALQYVDVSGWGRAALVDGRPLVAEQSELDRLERAGVQFAYLVDHQMPDESYRIMTIPVN